MKVKVKKNATCMLSRGRRISVRWRKAGRTSLQCSVGGGRAARPEGKVPGRICTSSEEGSSSAGDGEQWTPQEPLLQALREQKPGGAMSSPAYPRCSKSAQRKLVALFCWLLNGVTGPVRGGDTFPTPLEPP